MSPLEVAGVFFNLVSVWLTRVKNIWLWPAGIIGSVLFFITFIEVKLYADALLQIFFIALSLYGWWKWMHGGPQNAKSELPVSHIAPKQATAIACLTIVGIVAMGYAFDNFTDAALPYWDSTITVWSIAAQWMLSQKYLENWLVWIAVDVLSIGVFWTKELRLYSGLYDLFLCLAISGYFAWRGSLEENLRATMQP